jgi:hypothetical protein
LQAEHSQLQSQLTAQQTAFEREKKEYIARLQKQMESVRASDQQLISELNVKVMQLEGKRMSGAGGGAVASSEWKSKAEMELGQLRARDKELGVVIAKLILNEEASEASFTCYACMNILNNPGTHARALRSHTHTHSPV